ncbi:MAG: hypothetical protein DYG92_01615 [Leptolyngbya sp. PLA1]|nr:hypothetical protein [Leptolyngbya sp. PLA1]
MGNERTLMAKTRVITAIEVDRWGAAMLTGEVSSGGVRVLGWHVASRPTNVGQGDAAAVGAWLASEVRTLGTSRGRVVLVVPRHECVIKHLQVPTAPQGAVSAEDLAGIVRLQMIRQLALPLEGTTIDYVPPAGSSGAVLAAAMPAERQHWWNEVATAAGIKPARLTVGSVGAAVLLSDIHDRRGGPVLGIRTTPGGVEFLVIESGGLGASRAIDLEPESSEDTEAWSSRVAMEARRTWMSHVGARNVELDSVAVLGEGPEARALAERCAQGLSCMPETVRGLQGQGLPDGVPERYQGSLVALLGLLFEEAAGRASLDFLNPRKAPDRAALARKAVLIGSLGLIVLGSLFYVVADQSLSGLRRTLTLAKSERAALETEYAGFLVEHARTSHLEEWRASRVDWVAHLDGLSRVWPTPGTAVLDDLSGRASARPEYAPKKGYPDGQWKRPLTAIFDFSGKVKDREVSSDLRDRVLRGEVYTVESRGADTPDKFAFRLTTTMQTPAGRPAAEDPASAPESKGAGR